MDKLIELIEYESEGSLLDFKREEYPLGRNSAKFEFLKDISAMANHPSDKDKYIIIGVEEKGGKASEFFSLDVITDQAKYQQFLDRNIEPPINLEYKSFEYKNHKLAYFRIFGNQDRPYLFKTTIKDLVNNQKLLYKPGDGVIRAGTSTRELVREDLERIYKKRYQQKDRKSDIRITPVTGVCEEFSNEEVTVNYIDLSIENTSNKSLDFDVEMKVYKCSKGIISTCVDIRREMQRRNIAISSTGPSSTLGNIFVAFREEDDFVAIEGALIRPGSKTTMSIAQHDSIAFAFDKELVVFLEEPCSFDIEVTVRSDDFSAGALTEKFVFPIK